MFIRWGTKTIPEEFDYGRLGGWKGCPVDADPAVAGWTGRTFASRVAFRASRQITKTKPSIREEPGTGAFHRLTGRPHACSSTRTHKRATGFEPGSLRSRLRFGVTRPRSKRKRNRLARMLEALLRGLDANLPDGQRSPRSRNRFNDRPWSAPVGFLIGTPCPIPSPLRKLTSQEESIDPACLRYRGPRLMVISGNPDISKGINNRSWMFFNRSLRKEVYSWFDATACRGGRRN